MSNGHLYSTQLQIGDCQHFHVKRVEVFTGNDEYEETDCYRMTSDTSGKLRVSHRVVAEHESIPSRHRIRYEPGVRIFVEAEYGKSFMLSLSHHKGGVYMEIDDSPKEYDYQDKVI